VAVAAMISAALFAPLAVFGGTGLAKSSSAAQYQYKITICHHTHSKKHPAVTIRVSVRAWPAHQRHGDTMGACSGSGAASHGQSGNHGHGNGHGNGGGNGSGNGHGKGHGK
jgi:hypothetical protein